MHIVCLCFADDRFRDAVRREDDGSCRSVVRGDVGKFFDEDDALSFQGFDDEGVMDNFVAHIDGFAVLLECLLDDGDGSFDTGAEAARRCQQHGEGRKGRGRGGCRHRGSVAKWARRSLRSSQKPFAKKSICLYLMFVFCPSIRPNAFIFTRLFLQNLTNFHGFLTQKKLLHTRECGKNGEKSRLFCVLKKITQKAKNA